MEHLYNLEPGLYYDLPDTVYHADPCTKPSLSHSILKTMLDECELKAFYQHPRLSGALLSKTATPAMEEGTLLHALVLGTPIEPAIVRKDNWTTKEAKDLRAAAKNNGQIAVLHHRYIEIKECAQAVRNNLAAADMVSAFNDGNPEVTIIWKEEDIYFRARVDFLPRSLTSIPLDLKFTSKSASPEKWERTLQTDYATQAAFYMRGLKAHGYNPASFRFIVTETSFPYCGAIYECHPSLLELANYQIEQGIQQWAYAIRNNKWRGYPTQICQVEVAPWQAIKWDNTQFALSEGYTP